MLRPVLVLLLIAPFALAGEGFFTDAELARLDEALDLMILDRSDLRFDKMTGREDLRRFRLPLVDRTLEEPLAAADVAWEWAGLAAGDPGELLRRALAELAPVLGRGEPLSAEEVGTLSSWGYAGLVESEVHDGFVPKPEGEPDPVEMLGLAARARLAPLVEEAVGLLGLLSGEEVESLRAAGLEIAGPGDDVHDLREDAPRILIDVGGNDRYLAPARATPERPVCVVLDLGGDDVYGDGESLSCGAALFGVAILWDRGAGNDRYRGGHVSCGAGLFGVGLLIDDGGDDVYECRDTGQGAGAYGIGLLLDRGKGNDRFHADLFGQGFASVGGFGLLYGQAGNDVYEAGGVHLHYPLFNDRFQSLSQGFSIGMRPYASGGIGLLVDDAGNDRYCCDIYGQGASYWFSYGALVDRDGNDTYNLGQYGQGGGIHLAAGCLIDLAGQDLYYNMHGVGTGGAHDWAVGILVDRAGDDYYAGSGGTQGGALTNSFAMLLDGGGDDGYCPAKVGHTLGGGRPARGMGSAGVFLDLGGTDLYGTREPNESSWTKEEYGAGIDLPDPPAISEAPPGRPHLSPEQARERLRADAFDEEAGEYDLEKLWAVACRWAVGEMGDVVPLARERLHEMGEPVLRRALDRVDTWESLEYLCVQDLLKRFGEPAVAPLAALLAEEDHRRSGRAAGLLADLGAKEAVAEIAKLLDREKTRTSALDALARLGAADCWPGVAALLGDESEGVRVGAVRCLQALHVPDSIPALAGRLARGEVFTVRYAAEDVLASFGAAAVPALRDLAADGSADLTARRHAVRALGRIGAEGDEVDFGLLENLLGDGEWRIRFEAAWALGRYLGGDGVDALYAGWLLDRRRRVEEHPHVRARIGGLLRERK